MWKIKALNGPLAGQSFSLKDGVNIVGRSPECDLTLPLSEVSKQHVKIEVFNDQILITDMGSRNGTFVDGLKVRSSIVKSGQTLTLYKTIFVIENQSAHNSLAGHFHQVPDQHTQTETITEMDNDGPQNTNQPDFKEKVQNFIDQSVMPGVFKIPELVGFKFSIIILLSTIVIVTLLSSYLPIVGLIKANSVKAGKEKASILATALRNENIRLLSQGLESSISVNSASSVAGVSKAYIIENDGRIIAPSIESGQKARESFVATALNSNREITRELLNGQVAASVPIKFYNPNTQQNFTKAYAIVIFDSKTLASSYSLIFAKSIQSLVLAFIFLGFISLFLIKLFDQPLRTLSDKLGHALRDQLSGIEFEHDMDSVQSLVSNLNSALNRIQNPDQMQSTHLEYNRSAEAQNIVQMIGFPAMAVDAETLNIQATNVEFEHRMGSNLLYNPIEEISDQAFKLSVQDLIETCRTQPDQISGNELEFGGDDCEVQCQAIWGKNEIAYYIISVLPKYMEEEEVA